MSTATLPGGVDPHRQSQRPGVADATDPHHRHGQHPPSIYAAPDARVLNGHATILANPTSSHGATAGARLPPTMALQRGDGPIVDSLPDELLQHIFEALARASTRDLCRVSRVNKRWHEVADALLYRSISFGNPLHHLAFSESLDRRLRRGSAIQNVVLKYPASELSQFKLNGPIQRSHYSPARLDSLSRTISTMSNLETLDVAVPVSLLRGIGALFNGPFDLACLTSCSLFYQCPDDAYWDLRENIHIFSHPTLESLYIRRAKLDHRGFDFIERPHETPLKTLHLIDCDINDDGLSDILEFPEGLVEFVMTQSEEPYPELEESSDNIGHYITALHSSCHSLESITIDFPMLESRKPLRMRDFVAVKTLRLNWDYQLFGRSSKKPRLYSVGLPPQIEMLELFNDLGSDGEVTDLFKYTIETIENTARKLERIVVVDGDTGVPKAIVKACKSAGIQLDIIGRMDEESEISEEEEE